MADANLPPTSPPPERFRTAEFCEVDKRLCLVMRQFPCLWYSDTDHCPWTDEMTNAIHTITNHLNATFGTHLFEYQVLQRWYTLMHRFEIEMIGHEDADSYDGDFVLFQDLVFLAK